MLAVKWARELPFASESGGPVVHKLKKCRCGKKCLSTYKHIFIKKYKRNEIRSPGQRQMPGSLANEHPTNQQRGEQTEIY